MLNCCWELVFGQRPLLLGPSVVWHVCDLPLTTADQLTWHLVTFVTLQDRRQWEEAAAAAAGALRAFNATNDIKDRTGEHSP